jgi:hypothetical protein
VKKGEPDIAPETKKNQQLNDRWFTRINIKFLLKLLWHH